MSLKKKTAWDQYGEESSEEERIASGSEEEEGSSDYEDKKLSLYAACGLNTMNMFGTGPFITIPFVVAAAEPPGPHALIGYAIAAFACMNDSLVWSELGSIWPESGGSYVYLRECFGRHRWGRLAAFIFVWQIMVSGPMECASGFIATAQYIAYIDKNYTYVHHSGIAFAMCVSTVFALYREIDEVGTITIVLWALTLGAIAFAIIAGYSFFDPKYIQTPHDAFDDGAKFALSMGIAARFAVYDFTGYYDVCFVGTEVQDPRYTIPVACVGTCVVIAMCFFLVDVAVIGSLEWDPDKGGYVELVTSGAESANFIMALFCETHISRNFAIFFTLIVVITIFGSCFSFMIGLAQIPYTAAKDGYFYEFLAHEHEHYKGLQDYSLLFVGALSTIFCFVELEIVIEGMLTMQLLVQFMGQGWGLIWYRYFIPIEQQEFPEGYFPVPLFPLPNIIQLVIFGFIFLTTETFIIHRGVPQLEAALLFLLAGIAGYCLWARQKGFWPFDKNQYLQYDEGLDHQFMYYDEKFDQEMAALKKKLKMKDKEIEIWKEKTAGKEMAIKKTDKNIEEQIMELGKQEFEIISLSRKIIDVEMRVQNLYVSMSDQEKLLTETKMENNQLLSKIEKIQEWWGKTDGDPVFRLKSEREETANPQAHSVLDWTVEDVYLWWRVALPRAAQMYIEIVKECQLNGVDLLGVDEEMLSQFDMKKVLIRQVLKQVEKLKHIALQDPSYNPEATKMPRSKSRERKADPSLKDNGSGTGYQRMASEGHYDHPYEDDQMNRAQSSDHHRREDPYRHSHDRRE